MHRRSYLLIDLREIPCIHHITTYVDNLYGSVDLFGMYIPIFLSVLYFYKVLLLLAVTMGTVSSTEHKICALIQIRRKHETIQS